MLSPTLLMRIAALKPVSDRISRMEGGIPPLVELLEFTDTKVQRVFAGARGPWHLKTMKIRIRLLNATLFQPSF
ncbi:hypothetical protein Q3G72_020469 [Acer saccharum]|nr:hypothetical protein Q3G72_020469 [Acer saccharum]